jgi:hypothetical protein
MDFNIMPAFLKFPKEAAIIGRLLAGYGELEFDLCNCLAAILDEAPPIIRATRAARTLFRIRGEEARIQIADSLMREKYEAADLLAAYEETISDVQWCRRLRNQYAHCHWTTSETELQFVQLDKAAKRSDPKMMLKKRSISETLLIEQEDFFAYTDECLWYLSKEYEKREGKIASQPWRAPQGKVPPLAYIGEER